MSTEYPGVVQPYGVIAHDGFVDEARGKFIVTGLASLTGTENHLAFIVVTPGSPPTFELKVMAQASNIVMEHTLYLLEGINVYFLSNSIANHSSKQFSIFWDDLETQY